MIHLLSVELIRLENSLNEKSNLYSTFYRRSKNSISDQIRELARSQRLDFVVEEKNGRGILEKFITQASI